MSSASTATRTNTALIDIPQSVSIVTAEFWKDTAAVNLADSFRYVSGAFVRGRTTGPGTVNLRGFETSDSFATDGVRMDAYKRELAGYERLEVVKGPPSVVQGRGGVGGLFNFILKKPQLERNFMTTSASFGFDEYDANFYRTTFDINRRVSDKHGVAARVAGVWQDSDDYIEYNHNQVFGLFPSVRWQVSPKLELIAVAELLDAHTPSWDLGHGFQFYPAVLRRHLDLPKILAAQGTPDGITPLELPYNFNAGGYGNDRWDHFSALNIMADLRLTDDLAYRQVLNVRRQNVKTESFGSANNVTRVTAVDWTENIDYVDYLVLQGDLSYDFRLGPVKARTLLGYSYQLNDGVSSQRNSNPSDPRFRSLDLLLAYQNPSIYYTSAWAVNNPVLTRSELITGNHLGYYIDQNVHLLDGRIGVFGGLRGDRDRTRIINKVLADRRTDNRSVLSSHRYGFNFKITPKFNLYAVKSLQNDPPIVAARYSGILPTDPGFDEQVQSAVQNDLREIGLKGEFLAGRLTATAAYWDLTRTGNSTTFSEDRLVSGVVRRVTERVLADASSKGFEFEAYGQLTQRLSAVVNYVNMRTEEPDSSTTNDATDTRPLRFAPNWSGNAFFKYSLRQEGRGWVVKAGANFVGPLVVQLNNTAAPLAPGLRYFLDKTQYQFDAGAAYAWRRYELDLQVNNVGNNIIVITRDNPPRTYRITFTARF